MKRLLSFAALLLLPALGCAQLTGNTQLTGTTYLNVPVTSAAISNVQEYSTNSTIGVSFATSSQATPGLACGTTSGSYTIPAKDNGIDVDSSFSHVQVVAGLSPSTTYYCQISATNTAGTAQTTFSLATTATPSTIAITSLFLGTPTFYNSLNANNQGSGDTFYNCKSNDGTVYMTSDDNYGFTISGQPSGINTEMSIMKVLSESPLAIQTFQPFVSYQSSSHGYLSDGLSSKNTGIFCMDRKLFLAIGRQQQGTQSGGSLHQSYGNVIYSADHGLSWNNAQNNGDFRTQPTNPLSYTMFGTTPTNMATAEFVHYCADDGTLGYFIPCDQHDQGDAYVYLIANEGVWNGGGTAGGGNAFYLARVPRAQLQNLNGANYQWFTDADATGDGTHDANWSSTQSSAQPILSNAGELGEPNVQYIPALNRYLMLTFYYPSGVNVANGNLDCVWLGYEAPHPWGPWTQIFSQEFSGSNGGDYNPVILTDTAFSGTTPTVLWTENYAVQPTDYVMEFATLTINHN